METEEKKTNIHIKLLAVKSELEAVKKDKNNPFHKSKYADINSYLEVVEPVLQKHNLLLLQPIEDNSVTTYIIDPHAEKGELRAVDSSIRLPEINDPQKLGSAITYYRRYTLASLLAMQAEDDDANGASKVVPQSKPTSQVKSLYKYNVSTLLTSSEFLEWVDANGLSLEEEMFPNGKMYTAIVSKKQLSKLDKYEVK